MAPLARPVARRGGRSIRRCRASGHGRRRAGAGTVHPGPGRHAAARPRRADHHGTRDRGRVRFRCHPCRGAGRQRVLRPGRSAGGGADERRGCVSVVVGHGPGRRSWRDRRPDRQPAHGGRGGGREVGPAAGSGRDAEAAHGIAAVRPAGARQDAGAPRAVSQHRRPAALRPPGPAGTARAPDRGPAAEEYGARIGTIRAPCSPACASTTR